MNLAGKKIVVTGAGSGIGRALVQELLKKNGVRILAVDLNISAVPQSPAVTTLACDLSVPEGTDTVMKKAQESMGGIDVYFANAGFAYYEQIGPADWNRLQRIYGTNVLTPIYTFQKVREQANGKPFRVVVTASAMGYLAIPGYAVYGATKASVVSFTDALRWELRDPCALTLLNPIATRTQFFTHARGKAPTPWPSQTPEHVARVAVRGVEADRAVIFPSFIFRMTLFFHRYLPLVGWIYQWHQDWILKRWHAAMQEAR
ncbi:MAG TPA: SDR family NAD(P)-dependent oxidoreductase [Oligoflexus sp.]|uniref:SDR family NAD(P)-dependent oxidoreductase n=1 Tax=Oligoflexus sp. TaxID=1971216 RepID=UPI002D7E9E10|nr:SDR family NAD(P)-dependent oxidoreductase [Oligoflexus sp.]HET9241271.1 SDR family NAD(P)-dependent oxidoreductase [Oligoflexus sp.]